MPCDGIYSDRVVIYSNKTVIILTLQVGTKKPKIQSHSFNNSTRMHTSFHTLVASLNYWPALYAAYGVYH